MLLLCLPFVITEGTRTQIWKFNTENIDLKRFLIAHLVFHEPISPEIQTCSRNVNKMHVVRIGNTLMKSFFTLLKVTTLTSS